MNVNEMNNLNMKLFNLKRDSLVENVCVLSYKYRGLTIKILEVLDGHLMKTSEIAELLQKDYDTVKKYLQRGKKYEIFEKVGHLWTISEKGKKVLQQEKFLNYLREQMIYNKRGQLNANCPQLSPTVPNCPLIKYNSKESKEESKEDKDKEDKEYTNSLIKLKNEDFRERRNMNMHISGTHTSSRILKTLPLVVKGIAEFFKKYRVGGIGGRIGRKHIEEIIRKATGVNDSRSIKIRINKLLDLGILREVDYGIYEVLKLEI